MREKDEELEIQLWNETTKSRLEDDNNVSQVDTNFTEIDYKLKKEGRLKKFFSFRYFEWNVKM